MPFEDTNTPDSPVEAPETTSPLPTAEATETAPVEAPAAPKNIQEMVASIDITGVTEHEIIVDLIAGIQQLAIRGTIALGLLERLAKAQEDATQTEGADI